MVFVGAEQDADRRIVAFGHHVGSIPADVCVQLAEVLVAELSRAGGWLGELIEDQTVMPPETPLFLLKKMFVNTTVLRIEVACRPSCGFFD